MKAFQADIAAFERLNTQVLGVSPDDVETHKRVVRLIVEGLPDNRKVIADIERILE